MKKLLIFISFLLCFSVSFGQVIVPRSGGSLTVTDSNWFGGNSFRVPIFPDTTTANSRRPSLDSSGKLIYTFDANAIWYRSNNPRRWVQITGSSIVNIFNNSITNVTFISQIDSSVTIEICTGADACDTISFTTNITNLDSTSVHLIDSTHFSICGVDTTDGVPVSVCDTVEIPTQQLYAFQNWTYQPSAGIVESGTNPLIHDTQFPTGQFHADMGGSPFYNYPIRFYQNQSFNNGSGIVSFRSNGQTAFGSAPNAVRLGVNFWGDTVNNTPTVIPGYFTGVTRRFGYGIGTNITANGDYGMYQDDSVSKNGGIFFHTTDVTNDEGVSIYAAPSAGGTYVGNLSAYFNAHFRTNGDVRWPYYPYTRSDGYAGRFLTTDTAGNMQLRTIPTSDSCGLFSGGIVTWDSLLTFDVSAAQYALCCDNIFRTTDFDTVQLAEPDTGFLRYDAIIVGVNGVEVVQGEESTDPEQPQLDSCQALLTYVLVIGPHDDSVAATQNICQSSIYDENYTTEFVVSTVNVSVDTTSTASVAHLSKAMDVGNWIAGQGFRFVHSQVDISDAFALKFYINLKATLGVNPRIKLDWFNGNTAVSNIVNLGGNGTQFGFSRLVLGYQVITIPINAWTFTSKNITALRVTLSGTGSGFYMDWVQLQGCNVSPPPTPNNISFASGNLSPLFTTTVVNPTTNITQSFAQIDAPAYTVFGNPFDTAAARQDFTINLSTPQTVGLLDVERIAPCGEGYFIATVDGVQTCVPNPSTEIAQIIVLPPLRIDTLDNDTYDTLSLNYGNWLYKSDTTLTFGSSQPDSALLSFDTYVGTNNFLFNINNGGGNNLFVLDPVNFQSYIRASNNSAASYFQSNADFGNSNVNFSAVADNGIGTIVSVTGNAISNYLTATADTIVLNSTLSGASPGYVWTLADPLTGSGYWGVAGGTGQRFGIEDNLGVQNRYMNMQQHDLTIDSIGFYRNTARDGDNFSQIYSDGDQFAFTAWNQTASPSFGATALNIYNNRIAGFNSTYTDTAVRFYIQSIDSLNITSPTRIAVWDADTLKSADVSSIIGAGQRFGYPGEDHLGAEDRYFVNPSNNIFIQSGDSNYVTTEAELGVNTDQAFLYAQKISGIQGSINIGANGSDLGNGTFAIDLNSVKEDSSAEILLGHPGLINDNYGEILLRGDGGIYILNVLDSAEYVGTVNKGLGVTSDGRVVITNAFQVFTPANSTDATYPNGTLTADNSFLYFRKSDGTWVKKSWDAF